MQQPWGLMVLLFVSREPVQCSAVVHGGVAAELAASQGRLGLGGAHGQGGRTGAGTRELPLHNFPSARDVCCRMEPMNNIVPIEHGIRFVI
jgi:hypothetical protein